MKHPPENSSYYHHQSDVAYPMMNLQEFIHEQTQGFSDSADSGSDRGSGQSDYGSSTGCYSDSKPTTIHHTHSNGNHYHSSGHHLSTEFSSSDIALATSPGAHYHFDPSNARFSDDDLKPQPIISKSRKTLVPDTMKDNRYWARRAKNNFAAKRSREARRLKENQIILRAAYLERENQSLRSTVERLTKENEMLRIQESTSSMRSPHPESFRMDSNSE